MESAHCGLLHSPAQCRSHECCCWTAANRCIGERIMDEIRISSEAQRRISEKILEQLQKGVEKLDEIKISADGCDSTLRQVLVDKICSELTSLKSSSTAILGAISALAATAKEMFRHFWTVPVIMTSKWMRYGVSRSIRWAGPLIVSGRVADRYHEELKAALNEGIKIHKAGLESITVTSE